MGEMEELGVRETPRYFLRRTDVTIDLLKRAEGQRNLLWRDEENFLRSAEGTEYFLSQSVEQSNLLEGVL